MNPLVITALFGLAASAKGGAGKLWSDKTGKLLILAGVGYVGYKVINTTGAVIDTAKDIIGLPVKFFENLTRGWSEQQPPKETEEAFGAIVRTIKVNAAKLTMNETAYITIANALENQMKGWNFPGQFAAIENTLKGVSNSDDFKAVWLAFGLRRSTGIGQKYENLTQWLQGDLSSGNYAILQNRFKQSGLL